MIMIILFVVLCFAWQGVKDKMRSGRPVPKPRVHLPIYKKPEVAQCGCELAPRESAPRESYPREARVIRPCAAHDLMKRLGDDQ